MKISGNLIDLFQRRIYFAEITIEQGTIFRIEEKQGSSSFYLLPGFIDAHVHVESSMLIPSEFARLAVIHGTVATVSDPHEIANVLGLEGVKFMLDNASQVPFKFFFGAPSCVPATTFETAGAAIDSAGVRALLQDNRIFYLAEMMNYPGVLFNDTEVMKKIAIAKELGKPVDGHAPGVRGNDAVRYFNAGITTDHECFTYEEGLEKAKLGVKILIREGSAARNFDALIPLLEEYPEQVMFCSDDKHPDELAIGHINQLAARALKMGCELFNTLRAACLHPVEHYKLPVGLLRVGDPADFIVVSDITDFSVRQTWINGQLVAESGESKIQSVPCIPVNRFETNLKTPKDFSCFPPDWHTPGQALYTKTIRILEGQLVTESFFAKAKIESGQVVSDVANDILKFAVVNRYKDCSPALAFISNFKLKRGAIASCVGHDSHNILVVGVDDQSICRAVNLIVENKGGISAVNGKGVERIIPLPVAGIMSIDEGMKVGKDYTAIDAFVKQELGCPLRAPFMSLSFMALLVIPELKLSDLGLFDGKKFEFTELFSPSEEL